MRYYLRNPVDQAVTGSFELEDIEAMFKAGKITGETLVTGDIGEGLSQVRRTPAEDWMPVKSIPGFGRERPPSVPLRKAASPSPARTPPTPAELFPAHIWGKPQSPPEQISFCPFCGQRASGLVVLGETKCERCGKLLYPAARDVGQASPEASRPVSFLTFIAGVIGGAITQFVSFVMVCWFAAALFGLRKSGNQAAIVAAILLCLAWVAVAIPMGRKPANRGFAFGILLGVGLTALLTASCALTGLK